MRWLIRRHTALFWEALKRGDLMQLATTSREQNYKPLVQAEVKS